jgi:hypothetical protein
MALAGDLADFSLVDLIQLIDLGRKSGGVEIHGRRGVDQFDGWIFFDEGKLCAAHLGHLQGAEAVYTLFTCTGGLFQLHEQVALPPPNVAVSNEALIMEGSVRQEEWALLVDRAPPPSAVLRLVANPPASSREINLEASKWRILTMINGKNTVAEIVRFAGLGEFAALKIVVELLDAGLIEARVEEKRVEPLYHELERLAIAGIGNSARVLLSDAFRRAGLQPNDTNMQPQQMLQAIGAFEQATTLLLGPSRARALAEQLRTRVRQPAL